MLGCRILIVGGLSGPQRWECLLGLDSYGLSRQFQDEPYWALGSPTFAFVLHFSRSTFREGKMGILHVSLSINWGVLHCVFQAASRHFARWK